MDSQNKDQAIELIEDKGQRLIFTDKARRRIYSVNLVQFLNYIPGPCSEELEYFRTNIRFGWDPVVLSCKNILMCKSDSGFLLTNPLTKELKEVPKSPLTKMNIFPWELHGFGFDDSTNQYKVVEGKGCANRLMFIVYESLTDSWRKTKTEGGKIFPYKQTRVCRKSGTVLNGGVHWLVEKDESLVIIRFGLADEKVREIQVPPNCDNQTLELGLFRDQLCITYISVSGTELGSEFWVMKEYGVKKSWTKMEFIIPFYRLQHSGFWTGSFDLMLVDAEVLLMLDFENKGFWELSMRHTFGDVAEYGSIGVYVESSMPLIDQEQQEKNE